MSFKKNNIKKTSSFLPNLIGIVALCLIFILWLIFIKNINFFNFEIIEDKKSPLIKLSDIKSEENIETIKEKENKDKINILIVWRWGWEHDAPNLTDTIILASINTNSKNISLLSIPRDLYVDYPLTKNDWKINWLYAKYKFESGSQQKWMITLKNKVSEITWEKIDFFVNVDFKWFTEIIDTIGWIEIEIPSHFVDEEYPDWNWWYRTLVFKKGTWIFNWENALKYARSRHSTSDFDRSTRQQQVIKSIKDKLTWSYFLTSPWKIKELYEVFIKNVYTDLNLTTIIKLAYNLNWSWDYKIISSNINNSCFYWSDKCEKWGFLYNPSREFFWWMSVLLVDWTDIKKLSDYSKLHKFTDIVFNNNEIFNENYKINIFNSLKINHLAWALSNNVIKYWFNIPNRNSIWNTPDVYKKSIIYYNNINEDSETIKTLKKFFKWEFKKTDFPLYSKDNANIEIIIWEDYLWNNKIFTF